MLTPRHVAAVILNYGAPGDTCACLEALYAAPDRPGALCVVDNASPRGDRAALLARWRELEPAAMLAEPGERPALPCLIALSENLGYAGGNNAGIRAALADPRCGAIWLLNNDTLPRPGALRALCDALNEDPTAGMAGSTLIFPGPGESVQCAGGFSFCQWTGRAVPILGGKRLDEVIAVPARSVAGRLGYLCGASLLVPRRAIDRIGLIPEEYFLYYEDTAYGLRCLKAGMTLAWAPQSVVVHAEGGATGAQTRPGSFPLRSPFVDYLALRNRAYLVRRCGKAHVPVLLLSFLGVALNRLRRGQGKRLPLLWRAVRDGLAGRMGRPARDPRRFG